VSARRGFLTPVQSRRFTTVGLRPPLLVGATCVRRAKATFAMHKRQFARAAGVSPPWVDRAHINSAWYAEDCRLCKSAVKIALLLPRWAYAHRSCVGVRTSAGEKTIFAMHERTLLGAAGVSPPWFLTPVQSREFTTVGLRPPLLVGVRTSAGDKTIFAMHERTVLGAAGVSPPWVD
jgi:hypothetical protein